MLNLSKVHRALEANVHTMQLLQAERAASLQQANGKLTKSLNELTMQSWNDLIRNTSGDFIAALVTEEWPNLVHSLVDDSLTSPLEVAKWKLNILQNRITAAVDGSQIEPNKEVGLGFGALQIGWFINEHSPDGDGFVKDNDFRLLMPKMSSGDDDDYDFKSEIAFERTKAEMERAILIMEAIAERVMEPLPVCLFDGSLSLSYVHDPTWKRRYSLVLADLLTASERLRIPVVGFIDTSLSQNVVKALECSFGSVGLARVTDTSVLADRLCRWGLRSATFEYYDSSAERLGLGLPLGFCYLRCNSQTSLPARLEFPMWVHRAGLVDEVAKVLLAETLVGGGYPYPLEAADSIAVIQGVERDAFYNLLRRRKLIGGELSAKQSSKNVRRRPRLNL